MERWGGISRVFFLILFILGLGHATQAAGVPEPAGYRMQDYRAPVPDTLQGARVIDTKAAEALWRAKKAIFIDVLPRPPKPALPEGTIYREKPRYDIPGSIWLVDTGYGALSPEMEDYLRTGLAEAAHGDKAAALVFYGLSNCWMSWNAAKRALAYGYTQVIWYPHGSDGWHDAGLPLELKEPAPRPGESP
jgi:PQQ-dependent catabolism-associated CXXCW motif protein